MGFIEVALEYISIGAALTLISVCYVLYKIAQRIDEHIRMNRLGQRAPRVPNSWPFGIGFAIRSVRAMRKHRNLDMWLSVFNRVGIYTAETRIVGQRICFTADPENIKAILATQFTDFGKGEPFHKEWENFLGDSIFVTDGEKWQASRHLLRPQFVRDRVSDLHTFEDHLQTFFRAMANGGPLNGKGQKVDMRSVNGKVIEISDLLFRYTLDVTTGFLLGKDVESLTTPRQEFAEAFNEVQRVQSMIARTGPLNALIPRGSQNRGLKVMDDFINPFIDRALRLSPAELASKTRADQGYTFLHELASFTRDRKVIRDQLAAVLLAGRDTTAATLSWAVYELGRHPEAVARLRREILHVVGPRRTPTYADLKGMKYLQNVMNETLRLYPAVPFNVRMALRDTTLPRGGGPDGSQPLAVTRHTPVGYSTLIMQRRRDLCPPASERFADPAVFSPDRWQHWQPRPWQYIPFNGGPRICLGQQFALTEMGYVLVRLFQRFDRVVSHMADVDGGLPTLKSDIVLQPGDGVRVAFWEAPETKADAAAGKIA